MTKPDVRARVGITKRLLNDAVSSQNIKTNNTIQGGIRSSSPRQDINTMPHSSFDTTLQIATATKMVATREMRLADLAALKATRLEDLATLETTAGAADLATHEATRRRAAVRQRRLVFDDETLNTIADQPLPDGVPLPIDVRSPINNDNIPLPADVASHADTMKFADKIDPVDPTSDRIETQPRFRRFVHNAALRSPATVDIRECGRAGFTLSTFESAERRRSCDNISSPPFSSAHEEARATSS